METKNCRAKSSRKTSAPKAAQIAARPSIEERFLSALEAVATTNCEMCPFLGKGDPSVDETTAKNCAYSDRTERCPAVMSADRHSGLLTEVLKEFTRRSGQLKYGAGNRTLVSVVEDNEDGDHVFRRTLCYDGSNVADVLLRWYNEQVAMTTVQHTHNWEDLHRIG